jgi:hypothetical protein
MLLLLLIPRVGLIKLLKIQGYIFCLCGVYVNLENVYCCIYFFMINYCLYVSDFLISRGIDAAFEKFSKKELADQLRMFYCCVRQKPGMGETTGKEYSRSAYRNMRAGLQRYLVSPPISLDINLMSDTEFRSANQVFDGKIVGLKKSGKDQTQHKAAIEREDMEKFYASGVLSNDNPVSLQRKIFLEIALHFGRRGREGWRSLTVDSFKVCKDSTGREYVTLNFQEFDKNHPGSEEKQQYMFSMPESNRCPVASFKMYCSKLNPNCSAFLQRPLQNYQGREVWYSNAPLGVNSIGKMLVEISRDSGASRLYTNHCIKASTATILKQAGYQPQDIMAVTGHRNVASLNSYAKGPSMSDRANMSLELAKFGGVEDQNDLQLDVMKSHKGKATSTCVSSTVGTVSYENTVSSVFAGANFNGNVTINVQINTDK